MVDVAVLNIGTHYTGGSTCDEFHRVERLVMIFLTIFTTNRKHHKSRVILVMIFSGGLKT